MARRNAKQRYPGDAPRKPPRPLDEARLEELALHYVGRFATTRSKLCAYLKRKLRERGWEGAAEPATEALAERLAGFGYIDDAAYALAKARALGQRGFGRRRVTMALREAGIGEEDARPADALAREQAIGAAVRFAQRRRIGPFASGESDPAARQKALSAMVRAGHDFDLSRRIVARRSKPGTDGETLAAQLAEG